MLNVKREAKLKTDVWQGKKIETNARALRRQGIEKQMFGFITKSKIELQWMKLQRQALLLQNPLL